MKAFLQSRFSLNPAAAGQPKRASQNVLFEKVDPAVDGPDCEHDCASCTVKYPAKFEVDTAAQLYGKVNEWATHVLVATGKTDWVRDIADEKGSVMRAIEKKASEPTNGKLKLSASNIPVPEEYDDAEEGHRPTRVLILPAFQWVDHVTPQLADELITRFVSKSVTTTTLLNAQSTTNEVAPPQFSSPLEASPCKHAAVILLCSQKTRDARCGQSAPLLRKEFERHLRPLGLYRDIDDERPGGVGIYFISHVGGHKFAVNVIIYRRNDFKWYERENEEGRQAQDTGAAQGIWLARVRPEDCEGIVKHTVMKGKVIKPDTQLRGGFDREKGLVSW